MRGMHAGDLVMDRDGRVSGMIAGDVIVKSGCDVRISGMIAGDVIVEPDASVRISGMVSGRIVDHGGRVCVSGMVRG